MTPADTSAEKTTTRTDGTKPKPAKAKAGGSAGRRFRLPARGNGSRPSRPGWLPPLDGPGAVVAAVAVVGVVVAAVVGILVDGAWPWVLVAVFALVAVGAVVVAAVRGSTGPASAPVRPEAPAAEPEPSEPAGPPPPPFSVKTAQYTRHQIRIVDRSQGHGQVVVPVSGEHRTQLLVEGRSDEPVELQSIRVVVADRRDPREGEPVVAGTDPLPRQHFDVSFAADPPELLPVPDPDDAAPRFPRTLARDELELFVFAPRSEDHEIDWHIELDWACGDRSGTLTVDRGDQPFRVTPTTGWTTFYPEDDSSS